jgi:hypothetical protein
VNPFIQISIRRSTGYTTAPDGSRQPTFTILSGPAQVQDLSQDQLALLPFNTQALRKNIYLNGAWEGVVRADATGGDVFLFDNAEWLVTMVGEQWPGWTKVIVTMQSPRPADPFAGAPPSPSPHQEPSP